MELPARGEMALLREEPPAGSPGKGWRMGLLRAKQGLSLRIQLSTAAQQPRCRSVIDVFEEKGYAMGRALVGGSGSASLRVAERGGESLLLKFADQEEVAWKLEQEYRILKAVAPHKNIVRAVDWQRSPEGAGFLMSYHPGVTLHGFYRTMAFDIRALQAHCLAAQLADAVAYLHSRRVAHRDLHSRNVIVETQSEGVAGQQREKVTLIDFGSASQQAENYSNIAWRSSPAESDEVFGLEFDEPDCAAKDGAGEEAGAQRCSGLFRAANKRSNDGDSCRSASKRSIADDSWTRMNSKSSVGGGLRRKTSKCSDDGDSCRKASKCSNADDSLTRMASRCCVSGAMSPTASWCLGADDSLDRPARRCSADARLSPKASWSLNADDSPAGLASTLSIDGGSCQKASRSGGGLPRKASICSTDGDPCRKASKCSNTDCSLTRMARQCSLGSRPSPTASWCLNDEGSLARLVSKCSIEGGLSRRGSWCSEAADAAVRMASKCSAFAGGLSRRGSWCSEATDAAVRMASKCSAFAGEYTMPLIMPPEGGAQSASHSLGPGSAFKRDAFALGLLIASLVRRKSTTTADMYEGLGLRSRWASPAPALRQELLAVILGLVHVNPQKRLAPRDAAATLPPPERWFHEPAGL